MPMFFYQFQSKYIGKMPSFKMFRFSNQWCSSNFKGFERESLVADIENKAQPRSELEDFSDRPKHPKYTLESERLSTFRTWGVQPPEILCKAGFFYTGAIQNSD